jgi:hypothetical protein
MDMYESIMKWHFIETKQMKEGMSLSHVDAYISWKALFKKLCACYNMMEGWGKVTKVLLSSTKTHVKVVHNDFATVAQCMLTDPQIKWEDYLWFDDNPLALPPHDLDYVEDINTSLAYVKTHCQLIKNLAKQVLLGTQFYMDAAVTGQFVNLP